MPFDPIKVKLNEKYHGQELWRTKFGINHMLGRTKGGKLISDSVFNLTGTEALKLLVNKTIYGLKVIDYYAKKPEVRAITDRLVPACSIKPVEDPELLELQKNYESIDFESRLRASDFFEKRRFLEPHLAWMEKVFLRMLGQIHTKTLASKVPADKIEAPKPDDPRYFDYFRKFGRSEERFRGEGIRALENGELMTINLVAGMATGFGGTAKAVVAALVDAHYENERAITYLDIKMQNNLSLQRDSKHHLLSAAMVSDATREGVIKNLQKFADKNGVKLVLIQEGTSKADVEKIWEENKDKWNDVVIVPLIKQPTCLEISQDGKVVGGEYMKGHGDFYDVVKSQLKDIIDVMGIKYVFSSNIDNTGALVSRSIFGYFIEQVRNGGLEAVMEAAEKFEGDKGGAAALIDNKLTVLEGPFVPDAWKDRFNGRELFPNFNTNTFWFTTDALLNKKIDLPLAISKIVDNKWLKIESIMGHGMEALKWKALVIDRGMRFNPAKFLSDLWVGRTDWMQWFKGRLIPIMRDGNYVPKPLIELSKSVIGNVDDFGRYLFGSGAYDSMKDLQMLIIGGEGKYFTLDGKMKQKYGFETKNGVEYRGNVAIIYEHKEGRAPGTLIIEGEAENDRLVLENSMIFVPAGQTVTIRRSVINDHTAVENGLINRQEFEDFLANAGTWTIDKKKHMVDQFFPTENLGIPLDHILDAKYIKGLTPTSAERATAALSVFKTTGVFEYTVKSDNPKKKVVYVTVAPGSKIGSGRHYISHADHGTVAIRNGKALAMLEGNRLFFTSKGDSSIIGIPVKKAGKTVAMKMMLGKYEENVPSELKPEYLKGQLDEVVKILERRGITELDTINQAFKCFDWQFLLENSAHEIAAQIENTIQAK